MGSEDGHETSTLTFLFTDIEGSTKLWTRHTRLMTAALAQHDAVVRQAIRDHDGTVFATAGDSFGAVFERAADAVAAACSVRHELASIDWVKPVELKVRQGLHTGTAISRDDDFFGPTVSLAARVEAAAHGGQILASGATVGLLVGVDVISLGRHSLAGFDEPVALFQIDDAALFPPLRAEPAEGPRGADLVGRRDDVERARSMLEDHRIVTITGPGGMGKTALARSISAGPGTTVWCDLVPVAPGGVLARVSDALGLQSADVSVDDLLDSVRRLSPEVIVLDNCEHVRSEAAELARHLVEGSGATVLATSRIALSCSAEAVLPLAPLDTKTDALELLEQRASLVTNLNWSDDQRDTARRICRRLDGIPLALELVASRLHALSVDDIDARLAAVVNRPGRGPDHSRHLSMAATIDWSLGLISDAARKTIGLLSVCVGGFDLPTVDSLAGDELQIDGWELIDELVAHSLVAPLDTRFGRRYRLLEPIREHVHRTVLDDEAAARNRHLAHYLDRLEGAYELLGTTSCWPWIGMVEDELDNLEAAHAWALETDDLNADFRLMWYLTMSQYHNVVEPFRWAEETVRHPLLPSHPDRFHAVGKALVNRLLLQARPVEESADLFALVPEHQDDPEALASWRILESHLALARGDTAEATRKCSEAVSSDPTIRFHRTLNEAAAANLTAQAVGDRTASEALAVLDDGIRWARAIGAVNFEAALLQQTAQYLVSSGRAPEGVSLALQAERLATDVGMGFFASQAALNLIEADLLGVIIDQPSLPRLIQNLEDGVRAGYGIRLTFVMPAASRVLATLGEHAQAALCANFLPSWGADRLPRGALDRIDNETWERAAAEARHTGVVDVAAEAAATLRRHVGTS